jgi:tryptophan synthase alpha chain
MSGAGRIDRRFAALKAEGRAGFVTFVTAGDPDYKTSKAILFGLPKAGADVIELGMPFSDPMADGPAIQQSSLRSLRSGGSLKGTIDLVREFRREDDATPIVLMGYFNPIYTYGIAAFVKDAAAAGVDGLIVVDLPPEEETELTAPAKAAGIDLIHLTAPTTTDERLPKVVGQAGGFVYYVSVTGVTGTKSAAATDIEAAIARIRRHTKLPIAVGFGIRTSDQAAAVARVADAAVVGSALVNKVVEGLDASGKPGAELASKVLAFAADLAAGVRKARHQEKKP